MTKSNGLGLISHYSVDLLLLQSAPLNELRFCAKNTKQSNKRQQVSYAIDIAIARIQATTCSYTIDALVLRSTFKIKIF